MRVYHLFFLLCLCLVLAMPARAVAEPAQAAASGNILVLGDSLSAEYGLTRGAGWVRLLQDRLNEAGYAYEVHNASISGDTTSGGLTRLPQALAQVKPDILIIELGGNDALRGLSLTATADNLSKMIELGREAEATVLLTGMQIPPNYGRRYADQFRDIYPELAERHGVALVPFFLHGIATDPAMFQADRIHPNEAAQAQLADNVWAVLQQLL